MSESSPVRSLQVDLPDAMMQFVAEQVTEGDYSGPGEYIHGLIRADQKRHAKAQLEDVLSNAFGSEDPSDLTPEMLEQRLRGRSSDRNR